MTGSAVAPAAPAQNGEEPASGRQMTPASDLQPTWATTFPAGFRRVDESQHGQEFSQRNDFADRMTRAMKSQAKNWRNLAAPMLPATTGVNLPESQSRSRTHSGAWYPTSAAGSTRLSFHGGPDKRFWEPLGSKAREWDGRELPFLRANADQSQSYANGVVPHWGKGQVMRNKASIAHELTWAFYRSARHAEIPQANDMVFLPSHRFNFWRDARPPFAVSEVEVIGDPNDMHPDGILHDVTYYVAMDYASEHMTGMDSAGGTFDNRVRGVAKVRIPKKFPQARPVHVLSWGRPILNWTAVDEESDSDEEVAAAGSRRKSRVQHEVHRHMKKHTATNRDLQVTPLRDQPLGPHISLPRLPNVDAEIKAAIKSAMDNDLGSSRKLSGLQQQQQRRPQRVFTAAAGFIEYHKRS
mmetsp:Transcript_32134/g.75468  ORF Transcript_32134/g.75468 Transcript_32134/m.75468 type:complete len:411 (+) Transcript_32134:112-1344(+)